MKRQKDQITMIIPSIEKLIIEALDGKARIADAKNVFRSNPEFSSSQLDQSDPATPMTSFRVHEMVRNATFAQMFISIDRDLHRLVMTQAQIINFCEKYDSQLHYEGFGTLFLTETRLNFFQKLYRFLFDRKFGYWVVLVCVLSGGDLGNFVYRLGRGSRWGAGYHFHLVTPQPAS